LAGICFLIALLGGAALGKQADRVVHRLGSKTSRHPPRMRGIQYAAEYRFHH
jgi:hypothetical protein